MEIEKVIGFEEVLTKGVPNCVKSSQLSAAAILSDGSVAPIIDLYGLGYKFGVRNESHSIVELPDADMDNFDDYINFSIGDNDSFLVPIKQVESIELVPRHDLSEFVTNLYVHEQKGKFCLALENQIIEENLNYDTDVFMILSLAELPDYAIIVNQMKRDRSIDRRIEKTSSNLRGILATFEQNNREFNIIDTEYIITVINQMLGGVKW